MNLQKRLKGKEWLRQALAIAGLMVGGFFSGGFFSGSLLSLKAADEAQPVLAPLSLQKAPFPDGYAPTSSEGYSPSGGGQDTGSNRPYAGEFMPSSPLPKTLAPSGGYASTSSGGYSPSGGEQDTGSNRPYAGEFMPSSPLPKTLVPSGGYAPTSSGGYSFSGGGQDAGSNRPYAGEFTTPPPFPGTAAPSGGYASTSSGGYFSSEAAGSSPFAQFSQSVAPPPSFAAGYALTPGSSFVSPDGGVPSLEGRLPDVSANLDSALPGQAPIIPVLPPGGIPTGNDQETEALARGESLSEFRIFGNQRIETGTIINYTGLTPGDVLTPRVVDEALKSLYATGLFSDVDIIRDGSVLVISVQENPVINRLAFEGNSDISEEALSAEVQLRPRIVYTRSKVQADTKRILEIYRRAGRFAAQVEPKIIELSNNRVDLVFEIDEGEITRVSRIVFIGNQDFSDGTLRDVILTQERKWYRFLARDDTYDPDRLAFDRELLRRFYLKNGYIDFRVISAVAEITDDRENFFITFTLYEGDRYKVGRTAVETSIRDLQQLDLEELVQTKTGDWYNAEDVEETILEITDAAGGLGYAFIEIQPKVDRDSEARKVDIDYVIDEGTRVFVERIDIKGNLRTLDEVIRREIELAEGDPFNAAKLARSQRLLTNLGLFDSVEINNSPGSAPDRTLITVDVQERATGEFSVGAGFSSQDGALGNFGIRERNFLGRGQDINLGFVISGRTQQIDLSFTEPYFLGRDLSAGFDIFRIERDYQRESGFKERSTGAGLRLGYDLIGDLRQNWSYILRQDNITGIRSGASRFIRSQQGTTTQSVIGQTLTFDRLNDRFDPSDGYIFQLKTNFAGLGGNVRYLETILKTAFYYPFSPQWVGSIVLKFGSISALGQDIRLVDRFFLGGDDFRGFAYSGIGPRDIRTGDALGGNTYMIGQTELDFPLGLPKELGISGRLFSDVGTLTGLSETGPDIRKDPALRVSVGAGIAWRSPFGPVRIFYGKPIVKQSYDKTESIRFTFGTSF